MLNGAKLGPNISIPSQMDTNKHGQQRDILRYKLTTKRSSVFIFLRKILKDGTNKNQQLENNKVVGRLKLL